MSITISKNENKELVLEKFDGDFYDELPKILKMVKEIGAECFCLTRVDKITIPMNVDRIGVIAFANSSLQEVNFNGNNLVIENGAFRNNPITKLNLPSRALIKGEAFENNDIQELFIPSDVELAGERIFRWSQRLEKVTLQEGLKNLGTYTFAGCMKLKEVNLVGSIECIPEGTFCNCESLESINIPEGITLIECCAFEDCKNLKEVKFPSTLTDIGENAFKGCALKSVVLPQGCYLWENAFDDSVEIKFANYKQYRIIEKLIELHSQNEYFDDLSSTEIVETLQSVNNSNLKPADTMVIDTGFERSSKVVEQEETLNQ